MAEKESIEKWLRRIRAVEYVDEKKAELKFTYETGEDDVFTIRRDRGERHVFLKRFSRFYYLVEDAPEEDNLDCQGQYYIFMTEINFEGRVFNQKVNCRGAIFTKEVRFYDVAFKEEAAFSGAIFLEKANFGHTIFSGNANLWHITFSGAVDFQNATFSGETNFQNTTFLKVANFRYTKFLKKQLANFGHTIFSETVYFWKTKFSGEVDFGHAAFSGDANFTETTFSGKANFEHTTFSMKANFEHTTFSEEADFWGTTFSEEAEFWSTTFSGKANFQKTTFSEEAEFWSTTFSKEADFSFSEFHKTSNFYKARFVGETDFRSAKVDFLNFSSVKWGEEGTKNAPALNLKSARIEKMDYTDTEFPRVESRHTYLILKNLAIKQNDTIQALEFYCQEMDQHYRELKWKPSGKIVDKLILRLEEIVSFYGTNPLQAILSLIVVNILFVAINDLYCKQGVSIELVMSFFTFRNYPLNWTHFFALILNPFLVYEVIKSLRKFSRKL